MIRASALAMILIAVSGIYFSVSWGIADHYSKLANDEMGRWGSDGPSSIDAWQEAFDEMNSAVSLAPNHPGYHQRLARLYRSKIAWGLVEGDARDEAGANSVRHLYKSLETRPYWAPAWAELALTKALLGEFDESYLEAFQNAAEYGPWEPSVLHILISLGRGDEQRLTEHGLRLSIVGSYVRGLRSPVKRLSLRTLEALTQHIGIQAEVIDEVLPYLRSGWPRGKSDDFFSLTNWMWPHLTEIEREQVLEVLLPNINKFRNPAHWVRRADDENLREQLCQNFEEQKVVPDLSNWCG